MIRIERNKVVIEFEHPCPDAVVHDIRFAIIFALQNQNHETVEVEKQHDAYFFLLLLLGEMQEIKTDSEKK